MTNHVCTRETAAQRDKVKAGRKPLNQRLKFRQSFLLIYNKYSFETPTWLEVRCNRISIQKNQRTTYKWTNVCPYNVSYKQTVFAKFQIILIFLYRTKDHNSCI